jgi:hypothetical protein
MAEYNFMVWIYHNYLFNYLLTLSLQIISNLGSLKIMLLIGAGHSHLQFYLLERLSWGG